MGNYKGRSARLVWHSGTCEVFGRVIDHTEVFIFEAQWGDWAVLRQEEPPPDAVLHISADDSIACIPTELLGRRGRMLLLAAPAQIRLEALPEPLLRYCNMPCRVQTSGLTPLVYDGRCVMISAHGLTHFSSEPIGVDTPVIAGIPLGKDTLSLPGRVQMVKTVAQSDHKLRVKFDELDRLTVGRLRSLTLSLT